MINHRDTEVLLTVTLTVSTFDSSVSEHRSLNPLNIQRIRSNLGTAWSGITVAKWPIGGDQSQLTVDYLKNPSEWSRPKEN